MERVACNLCGSTSLEPYLQVRDLYLQRPNTVAQLVRCTCCGLVYQNPRPTIEEILVHYPADYEPYDDIADRKKVSRLRGWANQYGIRKRSKFVTRHQSGGKLLDVGCASGAFLLEFRARGSWDVQGVELNDAVAQYARDRYGLDVITGTLEDAHLPDSTYDAVTMWDVLEHVYDPSATLAEIRRILKPDGVLVLRVPNLSSWDARLFGDTWAGYDAPRHLYVFSPQTLSRLLENQGFQVIDHSTAISSYMVFALDVRNWATARGLSSRAMQRLNRVLYHPMTRLATAPFFFVFNFGLRGPVLVTTARKQPPT